jgi:hypothetical protein
MRPKLMNTSHLLVSTRRLTAWSLTFLGLALLLSTLGAAPAPRGVSPADWKSIREVYEANRHAAFAVEGGHEARNPGQQWKTRFDGCGFTTQPDQGGWQWGLELRAYGFGDRKQIKQGSPEVKAEGQRVTYVWDGNVEEWFVNNQRGLEHGFTVAQRPSSTQSDAGSFLIFELAVRGTLRPEATADAQGLRFTNETGAPVVTYTGLKVWDADGKVLPARMEPVSGNGDAMFRIAVDERGARYPLTIDPVAQQVYLKASNTTGGDFFGTTVAVSGNMVVVGAPEEDSNATGVNGDQSNNDALASGAAYVFVFNGSWSQQAYLKASNTGANDFFGASVAISNGAIVIGAPGEDSNATGVNGNQASNSASDSGAAYVFEFILSSWRQTAYLKASNTEAGDHFGHSVAMSGNRLVVGALDEDSSATLVNGNQNNNDALDSGAAYVFSHTGPNVDWIQNAYLKASHTSANNHFGQSVAASEDRVAIGAANSPAYVFVRTEPNSWQHEADLTPSVTESGDSFGDAIAISGETIVVGAPDEDSNATGVGGDPSNNGLLDSGAAYVFVHNSSWSQQAYLKASNTGASDGFGFSVAVSGDTIVVGAPREDSSATGVNGNQSNDSLAESGAAYLFRRSGTTWSQEAYLKASNTGGNDFFGVSVAMDGPMSVVGADGEASNATGVNGNQNNDSAVDAGAVYTFGCLRTHFSLTPANTGDNAERILFATVERSVLHKRIAFIGNIGATDLLIQSITLDAAPGLSFTVQTTSGGPAPLPHTIPAGSTTQGLKLTFEWTPNFDQVLDAELRIITNDPGCSDPIIYHVLGAARRPSIITVQEQLEAMLRRPLTPVARLAAPSVVETVTFEFDPSATQRLTAEIPPFLGGGSVQLNNFSGSVTLSKHSIPNDPNLAFIRIESGSFTTPSFQLPNGSQTGLNTLTFGAPEESDGVLELASGTYTAVARAKIVNNLIPGGVFVRASYSGTYDSGTARATVRSASTDVFDAGGLLNIATRLRVQTGDNVLIGGFIISGTDPKKVMVRGIGPSLSAFFPNFLPDPTLELFQGSTLLATNDNWKIRPDGTSQQAEIEGTTIPPANDLEAALVRTLPANNLGYTAIVRGKNNATGLGLVETYDLDTGANSKLANISTRGLVESGNNILIGGFIPGNGVTKVIIRAIGPTLVNAGVVTPLQDPTLELVNASGTPLASNDDWKTRPDGTSQQAEIEATFIPPHDDRESALVAFLVPGNYTAVVRGKNNTMGIAVVEVYNIP